LQALDNPTIKPLTIPAQMHHPHPRLLIDVPLFPEHEPDGRPEGITDRQGQDREFMYAI
jgi:hypothetical protein